MGCALLLAWFSLLVNACSGAETSMTEQSVSQCEPSGRLSVALYGGIRTELDWRAAELECSGMPRPNDEGARLRFSGTTQLGDESRRIAIIIGLPELKRGQTVKETPANVTVMEEGGGRFFNSSDASACLADIEEQEPRTGGTEDEFLISGVLYCVAAIMELNGPGGLSLSDLTFSGHLNWMPPK
jgi:hypothetical protein